VRDEVLSERYNLLLIECLLEALAEALDVFTNALDGTAAHEHSDRSKQRHRNYAALDDA
jgi:hypothetical protein